MGVPISNVTRRVVYSASGTGPYNFTFEILANTDVAVYKDDALLTLTTDYTVTINANGTGYITLVASPTGATQIAIVGNRTIQRTTDFVTGGDFFANTVNDEMDQQTIFAQQNAEAIDRALKAPQTDPTSINMTLPRASVRANKTLAFDTNGNPTTGEVIGDNRGNWAAGTAYNKRDIVKDTSNGNVYYANTAHTSTGSQPISTNTDSAKWDLIVDNASAGASASAAAASASAAATSASNASTSATNAASSASTASTQASNASTSATNAANSATAAASSASTASTAATNAGNSATAAATSATNASNSASSASTSATNASNSATSAATSASQASTSASNAASSASTATTQASNAATSATNAANSATASANSATAAAASAAAAAASFDAFDDIYLGAKSSDPTVDNDGNALTTGDQYFNTSANELRVYNGSTWQAASTVGGTVTSLNVTGATTLGQNPTLSAGTANGVAYLNGSKVLTTGSAVTYDGTYFSLTNALRFYNSGSGNYGFVRNIGTAGSNRMQLVANGPVIEVDDSYNAIFLNSSGGENARFNSTGLGIGTSSPNTKIEAYTSSSGAQALLTLQQADNTPGNSWGIDFRRTGSSSNAIRARMFAVREGNDATGLAWSYTTSGGTLTQGMYMTSDGNLGLGVTPSAWNSSSKVIEQPYSVTFGSLNGNTLIASHNAVNTATGWKYTNSAQASIYSQVNGIHAWYTAPSGTAGNAISFTQAMTLDASGQLGIGSTSPVSLLDVAASGAVTATIRSTSTSGTRDAKLRLNVPSTGGDDPAGTVEFTYGTGYTVAGSIQMTHTNNAMKFFTGTTERARIDSSGNVRIGTTGGSGRLGVKTENTSSGTWGCHMTNSADTIMFAFLNNGQFYTGSGAGSPYNNTTGSAANCFINSDNGMLQRSTSSIKYKTDVQDATHGLAEVMALRPVTYKGKNDGDTVFGGLIAEEVHEAGLIEFVQYAKDGSPDALAYGNMVSLCIKAIQEQQAIIEQLKADVAALKGA